MKKLLCALIILTSATLKAQYATAYDNGMVVKLNEDGSKYMRFLLFGQTWFQDHEGTHANDGFSIKRARIIAYSQLNDRFLLLTHFGANGIYDQNLAPAGKSNEVSFFLHEMLLQYKVTKHLAIGAGIHNYGGISRANGQGTINMLTLENNRADWSTFGLSDQFTNHLGVYAKGRINKLNYRFSISDALVNTLDGNATTEVALNEEKYLGKALLNKGKYAFSGYVDYQFLDAESNMLAYRVGTYLGTKKVFNIGTGFFQQSNAIVKNTNNTLVSNDVTHAAIDVFYDTPIGESAALTFYSKYQYSKMGDAYLLNNIVGSGNQISGHVGYLIPKKNIDINNKYKNRMQPYLAYSHRDFNGLNEAAKEIRMGTNWYVDGQNAKISIEYQHAFDQPKQKDGMLTVQAMILL